MQKASTIQQQVRRLVAVVEMATGVLLGAYQNVRIHVGLVTTAQEELDQNVVLVNIPLQQHYQKTQSALFAMQASTIQKQVNRQILVAIVEMVTGVLLGNHQNAQMYVGLATTAQEA